MLAAVVRRGSMSAAAAELSFSPAAVSQQIAALERDVGTPLLVRHARGVRPTSAGALLARRGAEIEQRLRDAEREVGDLLACRSGTLHAGVFASAGVGALPGAMEVFRRRHPGVRVAVREVDADRAAELVRAGELDLAVVFDDPENPVLDRSRLALTPLGRDAIDVVVHRDHPVADRSPVALAALRDEQWILPRGTWCASIVKRRCRLAGFEPQVALGTDDHAAARSLAAARMGVAAIPRLMRQRDDAEVVVRPLDPTPARDVLVAVRGDGGASPAAAALRDAFAATSDAWKAPA